MNFKKILLIVITIFVLIGVSGYSIKKFMFPYKYKEYVETYSSKYEVDPLLVLSIMKAESNFKENAESYKEAKGLMQIMDGTGEWIAQELDINSFLPKMLFDVEININFGCWYIDNLRTQFEDLDLIISAYNAGSGNVTNWLNNEEYSSDGETLDVIPFNETRKYLNKVKTNYNIYKFLYEE